MALWPAPQYVVGSITFPGEARAKQDREAELDKRMRDQARELRKLREAQGYIYIGTNSAEEETETRKALDRVLDDLPKGRIAPKDCDRLIEKANSAKNEHKAFSNIIGRKP